MCKNIKVHKKTIDGKSFEYWYDFHIKSWSAYEIDSEGLQASDALYAYTKHEILDHMKSIAQLNEAQNEHP